MRKINCHVPSGFCTYRTFIYGDVHELLFQYRGEDCVEIFCNHIEKEAKRLPYVSQETNGPPLPKSRNESSGE